MNLHFIIGSYRPGKCGISDYVSLLSSRIKIYGVTPEIIEFRNYSGRSFLKKIEDLPHKDLLSIQFAPYSFSPIGLAGPSLLNLGRIIRNRKVHIMFHEIWIGAYRNASWKEKVLGFCQKKGVLKFLHIVQPEWITASNAAALYLLGREGVKVRYQYLFGNMPFTFTNTKKNNQTCKIAFFGTPYQKFPYELLAEKLKTLFEITRQKIELRIIGRQRDKTGLAEILKIAQKHQFTTSETGELSSDKISIELQTCSIGVSTTPYDVLGKSGATAAMLEHGLPVIAFDDGDTPLEKLFVNEEFSDQVFLLNNNTLIDRMIGFLNQKRKPFFDGVAYTAEDMIKMLN